MTAEIAILNRVAVTLAADSAMTVNAGSERKVYNSIDKIFELSPHNPVGIMIYNALEFMGIPLDVVIRDFRTSEYCTPKRSVSEIADAFFDFLRTEVGAPEPLQAQFVERVTYSLMRAVENKFEAALPKKLKDIVGHSPSDVNFRDLLIKSLDEAIAEILEPLKGLSASPCFSNSTVKDIAERYSEAIDRGASRFPVPCSEKQRRALRELAATFIHRDIMSGNSTGIVIAGFGADDKFPQVRSFEIDGFVLDKLKLKTNDPTIINRTDKYAEILPFAQTDMADSFLFGVAPDIEDSVPEFLERVIRVTGKSIIKDAVGDNKSKAQDLHSKLERAIKRAVTQFKNNAMKQEKEAYRQEMLKMVRFMPKQELADFAESMVNITSLKRHVSPQQETVAGPIDVAVISKSEGFIWVKRKHYFNASYNPRYFVRKFGMIPKTSNE